MISIDDMADEYADIKDMEPMDAGFILGFDAAVEEVLSFLDDITTEECDLEDGSRMSRRYFDMVATAFSAAVEKYMDGVRTDVVQSFIDSRKEEEDQKSKREKIEATVDKLHEKINALEDKLADMEE